MSAADASPLEWEGLTGVPLDTNDNVSFILFGSPTFAKIDDLLRGDCSRTSRPHNPTSLLKAPLWGLLQLSAWHAPTLA